MKIEHHCQRCGYDWESKLMEPKCCPACKSYRWRSVEHKNHADLGDDKDLTQGSSKVATGGSYPPETGSLPVPAIPEKESAE